MLKSVRYHQYERLITLRLKSIYRIFQKQLGNIVSLKSSLPITLQKAIFELQVGILLKYPYDVRFHQFSEQKTWMRM